MLLPDMFAGNSGYGTSFVARKSKHIISRSSFEEIVYIMCSSKH